MRLTILALLLGVLAACATSQPSSRANLTANAPAAVGRDGSSMATAVVINSSNEMDGINQEYRWIEKRYPGYKRGSQSLLFDKGRAYDLIEFTDAEGASHKVYFDITSFYGKM